MINASKLLDFYLNLNLFHLTPTYSIPPKKMHIKATVLPQISRPPETEWSQERIESFPMLANALTRSNNNGENHDFVHLPTKIESFKYFLDCGNWFLAELNAFYKDWDPQAYQQWVNIQYQQQHQQQQHANHLNQLLAHAFTRSRPINYGESQ